MAKKATTKAKVATASTTAEQTEKQGFYTKSQRIKADATPIDDVTKFAWDDDDYEWFDEFVEYTEDQLEQMAIAEEANIKAKEQATAIESVPVIAEEQSNMKLIQDDILVTLGNIMGGAQ